MKPTSSRNLQLDVLRGVAVLLVFGRHLELPRPDGVIGALGQIWFRIGWLGVDLFFVLSGFLIGGLLLSELQKHGRIDIGRFLVRRGLKIYPAYLVFIGYLVFMPLLKASLRGNDVGLVLADQWSLYWPNLLFLQNYVGTNPAGHTWTLAVEEHFYLMLPFALAALAALRRTHLLLRICLLVVPLFLVVRCLALWVGDPYTVKMAATHLRLDALLFGVGLRALAQYYPESFSAARRWRVLLVTAGLLLWAPNLFVEPGTGFVRTLGLTATYLGSGAFLLAAYHTHAADFGRWSRAATRAASLIGWIGIYSYAIYLWHVTTMGILEREIGGRLSAWAGGSTATVWLMSACAVSTGAVLAGVLASKVVEWPVLHLRDRLFPSRSGALPVASAPSQTMVNDGCGVAVASAAEGK